jgi:uncharacterized membrane protein
MAKRTRGSRRPGQRPRTQRSGHPAPTQATAPTRPSTSLTAQEEARAAEIEATIVAEERAAEQAQRRGRDRARGADAVGGRVRDASPLSVRASEEYAYVRRDVLRIVRIGGALLLILAVLFVLIDVLRVIRL